jgi:hypothetical protein
MFYRECPSKARNIKITGSSREPEKPDTVVQEIYGKDPCGRGQQ